MGDSTTHLLNIPAGRVYFLCYNRDMRRVHSVANETKLIARVIDVFVARNKCLCYNQSSELVEDPCRKGLSFMDSAVLSFNRDMAAKYGVTAALLYQELKRKQHYWETQGKLDEDGFFWCDQGAIAYWILVHPNTIGKIAKDLEDAGLIQKKVSYRPGTLTPTTWWHVISESNPKVDSENHCESDFYIKATTKADTKNENTEDVIPLAALTTPYVEITIYDSDENNKCIAIKHQVSPKDWNKAVRKWRKDESTKVMLELKDTGEQEQMTFNRIKKFNVRPKNGSTKQYTGGTAFKV